MRKPRIAQRPPRLTPLMGRASPKGSTNYGGMGKGIDMPNEQGMGGMAQADTSPLGSATAKYKHETPQLGVAIFGPK